MTTARRQGSRSLLTAPVAFILAVLLAAPAVAVTQEYRITVPVTIKGNIPRTETLGPLPVLVNCAVGNSNVALLNGQPVNAAGSGFNRSNLLGTSTNGYTGNVVVDFTATVSSGNFARAQITPSKPPLTYVCWVVVENLSGQNATPVNSVSGTLKLR